MSGKQVPDLGGLIQTKGAPRPSDIPQRGEALPSPTTTPAPVQAVTPTAAPAPVPPQTKAEAMPTRGAPIAVEPRTKSLTLRLSESQYQRLRRFAFDRGSSHQDVIEAALMAHLDKEGA